MRTRDPDLKRRLLLEAALAEFAEYGVAGARVDRIAKRAGVSPGLTYSFFDGKEGLFEAVYDAVVEQAVAGIPIDADDLPGYAGRLYDAGLDHPQVMRFVTWYALERGDGREVRPSWPRPWPTRSPRSRTPSGAAPSPTAWARENCWHSSW